MFETFALYNLLLVVCIWFYTYNASIRTYVLFIYLFIYSIDMNDNYNIVATQNIEEDEVMQDSSEGGVDETDDENWPIIVVATCVMTTYFYLYICKEPCMSSYQTGLKWVLERIRGHEKRCMNMFRMNKETFLQLCDDLEKTSWIT